MLNKILLLFTILIFISSCKKTTKTNTSRDNTTDIISNEVMDDYSLNKDKLREYKFNALLNGDDSSYGRLVEHFLQNDDPCENILPYSIIMADKYNNASACYYTYICLLCVHSDKIQNDNSIINQFDKNEIERVLYYLNKGSKLNHYACTFNLVDIYKNGYGVEKNRIKADSLETVLESIEIPITHY